MAVGDDVAAVLLELVLEGAALVFVLAFLSDSTVLFLLSALLLPRLSVT